MADVFDIFDSNAFKVTTMMPVLREVKYVPGFISSLGLFNTRSVDTTSVMIEKNAEENIFLIKSSPRGGVGQTFGKNGRNVRKLDIPHFEVIDSIMADEVQGVRALGMAAATETFQSRVAQRAMEVSQSWALTEEFHRLNVVINGVLLDADNSVIYDYKEEFGETQQPVIHFNLGAANPVQGSFLEATQDVHTAIATELGGLPYSGIIALCGGGFFKKMRKLKEVRDTYMNYSDARLLRDGYVDANSRRSGLFGSFEFGDILWVWYRGGLGVDIDDEAVHFVPMGVPGLFETVYGPADYIEAVNRPGQRLYARYWRMENGKGINQEWQSNVLHYCTRPRVLIKGDSDAG